MGKTHETLERAEEEYQENLLGSIRTPPIEVESPPPRQVSNDGGIERYEDLKTSLLSRYPDGSVRSILFNGTSHGDGTSTTAVSFDTDLSDQARGQQ